MFSPVLGGELIGGVKDRGGACHQIAETKGGVLEEVAAHHKRRACQCQDQSQPKNSAEFFAKEEERKQCDP